MKTRWVYLVAALLLTGCPPAAVRNQQALTIEHGDLSGKHYLNKQYRCQWFLPDDWDVFAVGHENFPGKITTLMDGLYVAARKQDGKPEIWATLRIYPYRSADLKGRDIMEVITRKIKARPTYIEATSQTVDLSGMTETHRSQYRYKIQVGPAGVDVRALVILSARRQRDPVGFVLEVNAFETEFFEYRSLIERVANGFVSYEVTPLEEEASTATAEAPTTGSLPHETTEYVYHEYRDGQNLDAISEQYTGSAKYVDTIRQASGIKSDADLYLGRRIRIPKALVKEESLPKGGR